MEFLVPLFLGLGLFALLAWGVLFVLFLDGVRQGGPLK